MTSPAAGDEILGAYRSRIDEVDEALIRLLAERFEITQAVGHYKAEAGLPAGDPERERRQIARLHDVADEVGMDKEFSSKVFRLIVDEVIRHHVKIANDTSGSAT